jgi:hypothetical protein
MSCLDRASARTVEAIRFGARQTATISMKREKQSRATATETREVPRFAVIALLAVIVVFVAAVRIRLASMPLERDEGEFGYMAQLILRGEPPYTAAYNMKLPGIYAAYALILLLFGQSATGIHLGLLLVNVGTIPLVYVLGKRLLGTWVGIVACACYAAMSLNAKGLALAAHATHFVTLCSVGGLVLLLKAIETRKWTTLLGSGLLLGLGFTMKQCGGFLALFGGLYLAWSLLRERPVRWGGSIGKVAAFASSSAIPFGVCCLIELLAGEFDKFWFWTVRFPSEYASLPLKEGLECLKSNSVRAIGPYAWIWILALIGLTAPVWNRTARSRWVFLLGFAVFSALSTSSSLYFREHYYIVSLPAVSLLAAVAVSSAWEALSRPIVPRWARHLPVLALLLALGYPIFQQSSILFEMTPSQACRAIYGANPFLEAVGVADYISKRTRETDTIAVLGSEAEIYFYARRLAATSYIYVYSLVQPQRYAADMRQEMIRQIERAKPKYLVFVAAGMSWAAYPGHEKPLIDWFSNYTARHYEPVGLVDTVSLDRTDYYWERDAIGRNPASPWHIWVLRRRSS